MPHERNILRADARPHRSPLLGHCIDAAVITSPQPEACSCSRLDPATNPTVGPRYRRTYFSSSCLHRGRRNPSSSPAVPFNRGPPKLILVLPRPSPSPVGRHPQTSFSAQWDPDQVSCHNVVCSLKSQCKQRQILFPSLLHCRQGNRLSEAQTRGHLHRLAQSKTPRIRHPHPAQLPNSRPQPLPLISTSAPGYPLGWSRLICLTKVFLFL